MKRIAYSIFAMALLLTATLKASAQSGENRSVSGFHELSSSGPFNVHVNINGTESLKISGNPEVLKRIETVVEDGRLEIKFKHHFENDNDDADNVNIYVTAKSLSTVINSGSGSIKVDGTVTGSEVNMILSGSGEITSAVKSGQLKTTISGSGSIYLTGHADDTKVVISGSGQMKGKDLKTGSASVTISGSGDAYFSADKTISARIVGSGNVYYSGNATVTDSKTIGSGSVSKAN